MRRVNAPRGREKAPASDEVPEGRATPCDEGSARPDASTRLPYPGGSGFDDPEMPSRATSEYATQSLRTFLDQAYRRPIRRARTYGLALGCVIGFVAGLATWALWYALDNPAAFAVMEVR